ncbi:MAG: hypothetical protein GF388_07115 [Candidatus Aegiribacteria sp.]|nr:hypothetical protein [Candidatus Aegiribacteria sp.]MBD3294903.1 hypothetical protein [Candidatus Fermentibacteria bacterium]
MIQSSLTYGPFCALLLSTGLALTSSCQRESRIEGRQRRLDTFRMALPTEVRSSFDSIESRSDCQTTASLLEQARRSDPELDAVLDSIVHAELIDTFTDEEIVYYFWYYFDYAIETGSVRGP